MPAPKPAIQKLLHAQRLLLCKGHVFLSSEKQTPINHRVLWQESSLTHTSLQRGSRSLKQNEFLKDNRILTRIFRRLQTVCLNAELAKLTLGQVFDKMERIWCHPKICQGSSNIKLTTEWNKYLNFSKVHAFFPGIKLSLHSTIVKAKKWLIYG